MVAFIRVIFPLVLFFILLGNPLSTVLAQTEMVPEEKLEAQVLSILEEKNIEVMGQQQHYQKLELLVTKGSLKDQTITLENGNIPSANILQFFPGDEVVVNKSQDLDGRSMFYITDYVRRSPLLYLAIIFSVLTVLIGRWRGVTSIIGMGISFGVIFLVILPQILAGRDPVLISILGSLLIIPTTFYLSHGINRKTTIAIIGTIIALVLTGILANTFVEMAKLTGFVSEEAGFLQVATQGMVNIKGLLLAGIIVGALGVLDDVTVSQAAVVQQLKEAKIELKSAELYQRAMDVGRDHIASMVNTLVLVYTGASMPLLLLFVNNPHPFSEVINYEIMANEIVRTLVGSIGLILAVPITTYIAILGNEKSLKSAKV